MKWNEVPDGTSLAMSKETAMSMRGSRKAPFVAGVICGVLLLSSLQSCGDDGKDDKPTPRPSATTTNKP